VGGLDGLLKAILIMVMQERIVFGFLFVVKIIGKFCVSLDCP